MSHHFVLPRSTIAYCSIAYGMYNLGNDHIIKAWQFIFVLMGPVTVVAGLYIAFAMPSSPATAWFLTPEERLIALERIRRNKTGTHVTVYKPSQLWEAIKDPRMYLAAISVFCASVQNGGVSSFGATIIAGFGFTTKETTLLGMTTGGSEMVAFAVGVFLSRWWKMRGVSDQVHIPTMLMASLACDRLHYGRGHRSRHHGQRQAARSAVSRLLSHLLVSGRPAHVSAAGFPVVYLHSGSSRGCSRWSRARRSDPSFGRCTKSATRAATLSAPRCA